MTVLDITCVRRIAVGSANGRPRPAVGDEETARGARARADGARIAAGAALGVGFEGGVVDEPGGALRSCARARSWGTRSTR